MTDPARIEIELNGEIRAVELDSTITALLGELALASSQVAVELNREIVPRFLFDATRLRRGDIIELVTFVGGG